MGVLGAALVGTGFVGLIHVEALRRLGRPMHGVLGSSPEKTRAVARIHNIFRPYTSYEELLADPDVKVVHLTSPNHLHYAECKLALQAKKHVICEKPLALTAEQTGELVDLAERASVVTAVNYNMRFYPLCVETRSRIEAGDLGQIYHITGSYLQDWLLYDTDYNWRVVPEEGGPLRAVSDIGTHWLDLVVSMTGQTVTRVCADLRTFLPVRRRPVPPAADGEPADTEPVAVKTEDYGSILLRLSGGASGCLTVSQVTGGQKNALRFAIAGGRGSLAWNSEHPNKLELGNRDRPNEVLVRDPALLSASARSYVSYPGGHTEGFPDTFKQMFRSVYDYIERGDWAAPRPFPGFRDGHRQAVYCAAILHSHHEQRWVDVPPC